MPASVISSLFVMSGEKTGSITAVMVSAKVRAFQDSRIISGKPQDLWPTNAAPIGFGSKDCFRAVVGMLAHPGSGAPPPACPQTVRVGAALLLGQFARSLFLVFERLNLRVFQREWRPVSVHRVVRSVEIYSHAITDLLTLEFQKFRSSGEKTCRYGSGCLCFLCLCLRRTRCGHPRRACTWSATANRICPGRVTSLRVARKIQIVDTPLTIRDMCAT